MPRFKAFACVGLPTLDRAITFHFIKKRGRSLCIQVYIRDTSGDIFLTASIPVEKLWKGAHRPRSAGRAVRRSPGAAVIQVVLPPHLRTLARVSGTIRDHVTRERRPFVRFFACGEDWSHESPDAPLPDAVAMSAEPLFLIAEAPAGG